MRARIAILFAVLLISFASFAETLEEFNARIESELQAADPAAVAIWKKANDAREVEKHKEAIDLYAQVFARVPAFSHALRRQAGEELRLGDRTSAVAHMRQATALAESPENLSMLAQALVSVPEGQQPSQAEIDEAKNLARRSAELKPSDKYVQSVVANVALVSADLEMLRSAVLQLEVVDPKNNQTHYLRSMVDASDGKFSEAKAALDRARALGLPQDAYDQLLGQYNDARPFYLRWWKPVAIGAGAWFGVFALLLVAGAILSRFALRAAREVSQGADGQAAGLSGGVRRAYGAVLSLCCMFYYASLPIVMLLVVAIAGALLYAVFAIGHIPIKLVILIVVIAGVSLWSMLKSVFIRVRDEDPGMRLDLSKEPKLRAVLDDVAQRIGTRAVDNVYLTPGTDVAVMERGKGKKERCLILGVAALDGFAMRPFKAVLGHEYGHFSNRDTAGGAFALGVRNSLNATAVALIEGGAAAWYSPAWLFINGFHKVFMRISQGASRLQEVLADRWAVFAYGADAFERGLRHVIERSVRFDAHVGVTLKEVVDGQKPLANLYTYTPSAASEDLTSQIDESLNRKASAYDSHPSPSERFELVHALPARATQAEADDEEPAWSLFADPNGLQHAMTAQVRDNVRANYGVEILAPEAS